MGSARRRLPQLLVGAALTAAGLTAPVVHAGSDEPAPAVLVSPPAVRIGQEVTVTVHEWPAGVANVELCGNGGAQGSADCDVLGAVAVVVPDSGTASVQLVAGDPPGGCPCVVRAVQVGGNVTATTDLVVTDAPTGTGGASGPADDRRRQLEVDDVRVVSSHAWTALFGAGAERTLQLTLRNVGSIPVAAPVLSVSFTDGDGASEVVEATQLDPIGPGDEEQVELTFTLPALSIGRQGIDVRVDGGDEPVTAGTATGTTPWGLVILAGLGAYLLVLRGVVAVLSRRHRAADPGLPADAPVVAVPEAESRSTVRWDPFGGVTVPAILGALLDAGAPVGDVERALATIAVPGCALEVREAAGEGVAATVARVEVAEPGERYDREAVDGVLAGAALTDRTRARVGRVLDALAEADASVRRAPPGDDVVDARTLVEVVAALTALDALDAGDVVHTTCAPISVAHGQDHERPSARPAPDPETAELLRRYRLPWHAVPWAAARCTPAGVAVLATTIDPGDEPVAEIVATSIGYGSVPDASGDEVTFRVVVGEPPTRKCHTVPGTM